MKCYLQSRAVSTTSIIFYSLSYLHFFFDNIEDEEIEPEVASDEESIGETLNLIMSKSTKKFEHIKSNKIATTIATKKSKDSVTFQIDFDDGEVSLLN